MSRRSLCVLFVGVLIAASAAFSDETFDKLIKAKKFKEAIDYADDNLPPASRTGEVWVAIARANEELGLTEKAMASYLVSSRLNPKDYESWLGAARIYNKLGQHDNALTMAKKALDLSFTGDASWEYASACIKLNRSAEAKKALEKVIETDPTNAVANRELGNIYFDDKQYDKAVPLLRKSFEKKEDADIAYKLGKACLETNDLTGAVENLKSALRINSSLADAGLDLARTYYRMNSFSDAAAQFEKSLAKGQGTAMDNYQAAVANEKSNDAKGALEFYGKAVTQFGAARSTEALLSRLVVGRSQIDKKEFSGALANFKFIAGADPKGQVVPDVNFLMADAYEGLKQFNDAIGCLEKALVADPKNVEAYARLADLYKRSGLDLKAKQTYEKMINLSPNDPNVYLILGQYNLKGKNYAAAVEQFGKSSMLKKSAAASEGLAIASANLGRWQDAKDAAQDALRFDPNLVDSRDVLAKAFYKDGNCAAAIEHLEFLVKRQPNNVDYLGKLAECYDKTNDPEKRTEIDKKIIAIDKKDVNSRLRYGAYLLSKKDSKAALATFTELATLAPRNADVFKNLYTLSMELGDKTNALTRVQQYLALNPKDALAQRDMGDLLYEKKELDGALKAYRDALATDPSIKGFFKRYAEIVIAKGQYDEAIRALNGKIKSGEATVEDYTTLGTIYQKKGVYAKAIESYQKALQMQPQNTEVLTSLAECQASSGQADEAIITYEQVIMMNQNAGKEYKALGDLYAGQRKTEQAMKSYRKYLDKVPDNKVAKLVGMYLFDQQKFDEAGKYFAMIKGPDAEDPEVLRAQGVAAFNSKNYKEAIKVFEGLQRRLAAGSPLLKDVLKTLAQSYELDGQKEMAARTYAAYVALRGVSDPDAAYKVASLQEKTNPAAAAKVYEENTLKYPRDYRNFLQLGLIYADNKATLAKSVTMFNRIIPMADSIPTIWLKLGEVYGKLGKDDDELKAYRAYVKTDPQHVNANKRMGIILVKKKQYKEGLIYLETASTLAPKDPDVLMALAESYGKTDRPQEAISALTKAKTLKPKDVSLITQLYKLDISVGKQKEAKKEIEDLIAINPSDPAVRLTYAQILYDEKKYKEAGDEIENVMATTPSPEALMLKGRVQTGLKDYKGAVATFDEVINNAAADNGTPPAPALYEKAELFRLYGKDLGKSPKWAETFYERALRSDPNFGLAELGLARLYKLWKRDDLYRQHLDSARRLDPNNAEIQDEVRGGSGGGAATPPAGKK